MYLMSTHGLRSCCQIPRCSALPVQWPGSLLRNDETPRSWFAAPAKDVLDDFVAVVRPALVATRDSLLMCVFSAVPWTNCWRSRRPLIGSPLFVHGPQNCWRMSAFLTRRERSRRARGRR